VFVKMASFFRVAAAIGKVVQTVDRAGRRGRGRGQCDVLADGGVGDAAGDGVGTHDGILLLEVNRRVVVVSYCRRTVSDFGSGFLAGALLHNLVDRAEDRLAAHVEHFDLDRVAEL